MHLSILEDSESVLDDYALSRVPQAARYSWWSVALQRFGQLSCLSQFLLGSALGFGMTFWSAFWALTFGSAILELVSILIGIAGQREGLSTYVLARWTGFGRNGATLLSVVIAITLIGWFGVQNELFAQGLASLIGGLSVPAWSLVCGLAVTLIVIFGFLSMAWTAYVTVPAFLVLAGWSIISALQQHSLAALMASPPPGPVLSLGAGTTLVAGGFIVGAVITPDMTRYNRSAIDVAKQTIVGITVGEYLIGLIGVLLAHAVGSSDVVQIVTSTTSSVGTVVLIAATLKINDWNLYSASLGIVNMVQATTGRQVSRAWVTLLVGLLGSILSMLGILSGFVGFLILLGVAIPPVAGIMVVEYFIVQRWRPQLEQTRMTGALPAAVDGWNVAALVAWASGFLVGYVVHVGVPSINSLVVAGLVYWIVMLVLGQRSQDVAHPSNV
jgi:cytosine permease